jgi:hypothetical protein
LQLALHALNNMTLSFIIHTHAHSSFDTVTQPDGVPRCDSECS